VLAFFGPPHFYGIAVLVCHEHSKQP